MTPHEKAVTALNRRLEQLQANLREAKAESAQRFLFQAVVVTLGLGEALNAYIKVVGTYAQRRHGELKQANDTLAARHAELLHSGKELLEKLKANPTDRAIRKEIDVAQQAMTAIQKNLRRGTNALQRDIAPSIAMIDRLSESVRRLSEADDNDALKRLLKTLVGHVRELFAAQPALTSKVTLDAGAWERSAASEIDQAADRYDAYARACYQAMLGVDMMTMVVSESPPRTPEEATHRANESVAARLKEITARFTAS